jgi:hypothetical protein
MKHASETRFCGIGGGWARREACLRSPARATTIDAGDNVFHHCKQILRRGCTRPCDTTMWSHRRKAAEAERPATGIKKKSWPRVHAAASEVVRTAPRCRYWGALIRTSSGKCKYLTAQPCHLTITFMFPCYCANRKKAGMERSKRSRRSRRKYSIDSRNCG